MYCREKVDRITEYVNGVRGSRNVQGRTVRTRAADKHLFAVVEIYEYKCKWARMYYNNIIVIMQTVQL